MTKVWQTNTWGLTHNPTSSAGFAKQYQKNPKNQEQIDYIHSQPHYIHVLHDFQFTKQTAKKKTGIA